jgi:hypothetical protein
MKRLTLVIAMIVAGVFGPIVTVKAESPAIDVESQFRFELEEAQRSHRGLAVEGYLYNGLSWRITNVRLRVESLDQSGRVTGEVSGWVVGDVKGGDRGYFFVHVVSRATTYRATVQSFDKVVLDAPPLQAP